MNSKFNEIFNDILSLTKDKVSETIVLGGIGARICHSNDSIDKLILDNRLIDGISLKNYLVKLITMRHFSVFEHIVIPIRKDEIIDKIMKKYTLQDMVDAISDDILYLFQASGAEIRQQFPLLNINREKDACFKLLSLLFKFYFPVIPVTNDTIYLNFRHVLEAKLNELKYIESVVHWFMSFYPLETLSKKIDFDTSLSVPESNGKIYILKVWKDKKNKKVDGLSFILDDVSRILTHQLVRHRLYCSYSQRSQRYTEIKNESDFVYPSLDYIKKKSVRNEFLDKFSKVYKKSFDTYQKLINEGIVIKPKLSGKEEKFLVRKEDARFLLPQASKTVIMITMLTDGFNNFLNERTNKSAQWEIRNVANTIKEFIKE